MTKPSRKQIILSLIGLLILAAIIYGFLPGAEAVETEMVKTGPLQVFVEEEGETIVEEHYVISSPVAAYIRRIQLDPGEHVKVDTPLVALEPPRPNLLDARSLAEATARAEAAEASLQQMEVQAEHAIQRKERMERLAENNSATGESVEQAQMEAASAVAARNAAQAELAAAQALVETGSNTGNNTETQVIRSPASGQILTVHRRSEGFINPGEPLLEIGDLTRLEVRVNVLSQDAVRILPGMRVVLDQWGGSSSLEAVVKRVEFQGQQQVSALGVEEQRVSITAELVSPPESWAGLGSGFRVLAKFIIWEEENVLQVPNSALFRTEEGWAVFVVENEKARRKNVRIGQQTGLAAQVLEGLSEGEAVIVHPAAEIEDGVKVEGE